MEILEIRWNVLSDLRLFCKIIYVFKYESYVYITKIKKNKIICYNFSYVQILESWRNLWKKQSV